MTPPMTAPINRLEVGEAVAPCPFCGGSATVRTTLRALVRCEQCAAEGATFSMVDDGVEVASGRAIEAWNRRASPPPPAVSVEEVAAIVREAILRSSSSADKPFSERTADYTEDANEAATRIIELFKRKA